MSALIHGTRHLVSVDRVLAATIAEVGACTLQPHGSLYRELLESIVSQQLSLKAAETIWGRVLGQFAGVPAPDQLLAAPEQLLRDCGLAGSKVRGMRAVAEAELSGELVRIASLGTSEAEEALIALRGVGPWTASVALLFGLGRLDLLPVGDVGLQRGIQRAYGLAERPTPEEVRRLARDNDWHPYAGLATWYLWKGWA